MTKLDELVSFILSDKLKEIRNFNCYDELVAEAKKLQRQQVKNLNIPDVVGRSEQFNCKHCNDKKYISIVDEYGATGRICPFCN